MLSLQQQQQILHLRRSGYSYSYIQSVTGICKSTLSYWIADVPYTPNKTTVKRIGLARARSGEAKSRIRQESVREAKNEAVQDVGLLSSRDLFMLGLGLYIGEGTKTHGTVRIMNSNPKVLTLALKWFTTVCGLGTENIVVRLHLYPDNDVEKCITYWSRQLSIPTSQFQKTHIDRRRDKKAGKRGKLPFGTAHITVRSRGNKKHGVYLARKIAAWTDVTLEKAGIV